jgi:pilus assembly protein FimV
VKLRNTLLGSTLLVAAFGSSALSLGRARGAVVLGQTLDLAVDVRLDSADDSGNACFEADVFHGDGQVSSNRVRVIVMSGGQGQDAVVRIRSSAIVDEPVVGVVLRSICGQKASRRYDFLTDFPVETRAATVPTIIPAVVTAPSVAEPSQAAPAPAVRSAPIRSSPSTHPVAVVRPPKLAAKPKPIQIQEPKESAAPPKPVVTKAEVPDNKPRLKLDAPEAPDERLVQLKSASDLLLAPTEDPQKREAAAAAWRELNHLPVENAQEKQRWMALEAESKTLKALLAKNEADFKQRLEKLENNHYGEGFVYGLLSLLLAAIAAAAFFWNRARQRLHYAPTDWARHGDPSTEDPGAAAAPMSRPAALAAQLPPNTLPGPSHDADVDESLFDDLKKLTAVTMAAKPLVSTPRSAVTAEPARSMYSEDFLDVQQHAEFFVSLGQYDQAIEVLKKSIHTDASPLAYLDLLKIYHTLGRQAEYQQQRDTFNRQFNSHIPAFPAFTQEGQTLEAYPSVLRSIEGHWGTTKALDFIASCVFRDTTSDGGKTFDLAAYRELLLLYAVAQGTVRQADGTLHDTMPQVRGGQVSRRQELELDLSRPAPLDVATPSDTTFTQPMALMSELAPLDGQDTHPEALSPAYRQPLDLDLDLDLNLDFSNSELLAMQELPTAPLVIAPAPMPPLAATVLDLDLDLGAAPSASPLITAPAAPVVPTIDSHMLEFDLFDPKVEAKISAKKD